MWHRVTRHAIKLLLAAGTTAAVVAVSWPRTTQAEEIADSDRMGEYQDEGMKFGDIVVRGELVADGSVPGGWTLVRTLSNVSDSPSRCVLEERVLQTETMPESRVDPPPTAVILRTQPIALGPHEKRTIGVRLPESLGARITAGLRNKARIERARERALAAERYDAPALRETYLTFHVEYLTPLPPGATVAPPFNAGVVRPEGLRDIAPPEPMAL